MTIVNLERFSIRNHNIIIKEEATLVPAQYHISIYSLFLIRTKSRFSSLNQATISNSLINSSLIHNNFWDVNHEKLDIILSFVWSYMNNTNDYCEFFFNLRILQKMTLRELIKNNFHKQICQMNIR